MRGRGPLEVGKAYRNGAGQVRRIVTMDADRLTYLVVDPGPMDAKRGSSRPAGSTWENATKSFRSWAVTEITP